MEKSLSMAPPHRLEMLIIIAELVINCAATFYIQSDYKFWALNQ